MLLLVLPDPVTDNDDLQRALRGDKQALAQLYRRYLDPIYQFTRLRVGDPAIAEDITSTVFLKMVTGIKQNKGPNRNVRGWLFKVARHEIYRHYGKTESLPIETIDQWFQDHSAANPESSIMEAADRDTMREAMRLLSSDQQEVLLLRFDQQLSLQETADIMGKNLNTVKTLQLRALKKLRQIIQRERTRKQL